MATRSNEAEGRERGGADKKVELGEEVGREGRLKLGQMDDRVATERTEETARSTKDPVARLHSQNSGSEMDGEGTRRGGGGLEKPLDDRSRVICEVR